MAMSSLTYIPGFSVKFFFQPIYTDYDCPFDVLKLFLSMAAMFDNGSGRNNVAYQASVHLLRRVC
jgi:hypothetical protein